jgi:hypothetical protein
MPHILLPGQSQWQEMSTVNANPTKAPVIPDKTMIAAMIAVLMVASR